jgi:hypothetical protein
MLFFILGVLSSHDGDLRELYKATLHEGKKAVILQAP